ncbi:50S ribosomal protein L5 [Candidatus Clavichlamydia salmonicola]|uniref:50S ribosomal protein L5 n=1 Tax=Candidatus Clavichlamydia salmonicola TaxID=469812 RepID=UPI0018914FB1|nr:50S ribosomal protein L5 [Candidatus Clavichlamydia salmonicola]MBF5050758.1 50S ribosomal protein L5 [Candidatus Clavichlamydia salmonicola]
MSRLKLKYETEVKQSLIQKFAYKNVMQSPRLKKLVISMGLAEASKDKNAFQSHLTELAMLSGQKPLVTKARVSVAGFKLREGQALGAKVTLRGVRMFDFMDRFFNIVCPRIRDFRGFSLKGDGRGSYSLGLDDQQIFPEINLDAVKRTQGMNINFVTTAVSDAECIELLRLLGLPFKHSA